MTKTHVPIRNVQYLSQRTILAQIFISLIETPQHCHLIASSPDQFELCLRCDALPTRLSAPVRGRKIKPKAYCSQRCHPPAKAWW